MHNNIKHSGRTRQRKRNLYLKLLNTKQEDFRKYKEEKKRQHKILQQKRVVLDTKMLRDVFGGRKFTE